VIVLTNYFIGDKSIEIRFAKSRNFDFSYIIKNNNNSMMCRFMFSNEKEEENLPLVVIVFVLV
jgi:hypothetical protein